MLSYPKQIFRCINRKDIIDIPLSDSSLLNVCGLLIGEHCLLINHVPDFLFFRLYRNDKCRSNER